MSHGVCTAGLAPSWKSNRYSLTEILHGQPKINYERLMKVCQLKEGKSHKDVNHEKFMSEYHTIFLSPNERKPLRGHWRAHSTQPETSMDSVSTLNVRSTCRSINETSSLKQRLSAVSKIVLKHPPLRSSENVKELASLIAHFPALLPPDTSSLVLEGIALRAVAESVRDRHGLALPREGGIYLILHGSVQELSKEEKTCRYKTKMLYPGDVFGEMKEPAYPPKHSYPIYLGHNKCLLMRITLSDYKRAKEIVQEQQLEEQLKLVEVSPLLSTFPQNVRQRLAKMIKWRTFKPSTKLLQETEPVLMISIIKSGVCKVFKNISIPDSLQNAQVCIGEVNEGGCIGELVFEGCEIAPYTVISSTRVTVGQILTKDIHGIDFQHSRPKSRKNYSVFLPDNEQLRDIYADKLVTKQWSSLKRSIIGGVYREIGKEEVTY